MTRSSAGFFLIACALAATSPSPAFAADAPRDDGSGGCTKAHEIVAGKARIRLDFDASAFAIGAGPICAWTQRAADAVAGYFGRFPVAQVHIALVAVDGGGVHGGSTYGEGDDGHPFTTIRLGRAASEADLARDWVMTHEMVHLAVPSVPRRSHWLEEGIATYVEPIARAQRGELDAQRVWADMLDGMPKGEPGDGDRGLDVTHTWGRTYWGGALFCLSVDVDIRKRTQNRKSLRDALRGVIAAGGNIEQDWTLAKFIGVADAAVGVPVFAEHYAMMGEAPGRMELDALWRELGVVASGNGVRFDDTAPQATLRKSMTAQ